LITCNKPVLKRPGVGWNYMSNTGKWNSITCGMKVNMNGIIHKNKTVIIDYWGRLTIHQTTNYMLNYPIFTNKNQKELGYKNMFKISSMFREVIVKGKLNWYDTNTDLYVINRKDGKYGCISPITRKKLAYTPWIYWNSSPTLSRSAFYLKDKQLTFVSKISKVTNLPVVQKRRYSTSNSKVKQTLINNLPIPTNGEEAIKVLEKYLLELSSILTPILYDMFGKIKPDFSNKNFVYYWPSLDDKLKDQDWTLIQIAIRTYVQLYTYLIAVETSRKFKPTFSTDVSLAFTENTKLLDINSILERGKVINLESNLPVMFNQSPQSKIAKSGDLKSNKYKKLIQTLNSIDTEWSKTKGYIIQAYDYQPFNRNLVKPIPSVERSKVKNKILWEEILQMAGTQMKSIIFQVWAVIKIGQTTGRYTPGFDKRAFKAVPTKSTLRSKVSALSYLEPRIREIKEILSIAKGKTDQVIRRKVKQNLWDRSWGWGSRRDILRRALKTKESKAGLSILRKELKNILTNPVKYLLNERKVHLIHNSLLMLRLLYSLKPSKLRNYKHGPLLRVYILKNNNKLRPLSIPTLKDRTLQMLLKLVMEPYMEPLGDSCSFGFRPGRNAHQATAHLHNYLLRRSNASNSLLSRRKGGSLDLIYRGYLKKKFELKTLESKKIKELTKKDGPNPRETHTIKIHRGGKTASRLSVSSNFIETLKKKPRIFKSQIIWDAEIKGCFDNISHNWLIENIPMPANFEFLMPIILKPRIIEMVKDNLKIPFIPKSIRQAFPHLYKINYKTIVEESTSTHGIPQAHWAGGIISPLFMNWTLDGLEETAKLAAESVRNEPSEKLNANRLHLVDTELIEIYQEHHDNLIKAGLPGIITYPSTLINLATIPGYRNTWVIRYADNFIIGVKHQKHIEAIILTVRDFLKERGLEISEEKTKTISWKMGAKLNFLSWTHNLIWPRKPFWLIIKDQRIRGKLSDWRGTYSYPSVKATKNLRKEIVELTNRGNVSCSDSDIIKKLNSLTRGWLNYYTPCPNLRQLLRNLDIFLLKRFKQFLFKKYGNSYFKYYLNYFTYDTYENWKLNKRKITKFRKNPMISSTAKNNRIKVLPLKLFTDLYNGGVIWAHYFPTIDMLRNSLLTHPEPFIKRAINVASSREDTRAKLLVIQKLTCPLCNKPLIDWQNILRWDIDPGGLFDNLSEYNLGRDILKFIECKEDEDNKFKQSKFNKKGGSSVRNILDNKNKNWFKDLEKDHKIPKIITTSKEQHLKILNDINNLQLVHKNCHSLKSILMDPWNKKFKRTIKNLVGTYTNKGQLINIEYELARYITIVLFDLLGDFSFLCLNKEDNKKIKQIVKISKTMIPKDVFDYVLKNRIWESKSNKFALPRNFN